MTIRKLYQIFCCHILQTKTNVEVKKQGNLKTNYSSYDAPEMGAPWATEWVSAERQRSRVQFLVLLKDSTGNKDFNIDIYAGLCCW